MTVTRRHPDGDTPRPDPENGLSNRPAVEVSFPPHGKLILLNPAEIFPEGTGKHLTEFCQRL